MMCDAHGEGSMCMKKHFKIKTDHRSLCSKFIMILNNTLKVLNATLSLQVPRGVVTSGRTSTQKLKLSVVGASDPSAQVKNFIARELQADNIFVSTHAFDACVAY